MSVNPHAPYSDAWIEEQIKLDVAAMAAASPAALKFDDVLARVSVSYVVDPERFRQWFERSGIANVRMN